jgi:molecular chaperone GrpE
MNDDTQVDEPKAEETAGSAAPTTASRFADEAEGLSAEMERLFRRAFGEIPKSSDLGELRSLQAMLKGLVHRASGGAPEGKSEGGEKALADLTAERDKLKDALQREKAGFLNYQARSMKDLERAEEQALRKYVSELLPILDNLDLATADAHSDNFDPKRVKEALDMTGSSLKQALAVRGLERIDSKGKPFDPKLHEAIFKRPADREKGEKHNYVSEETRAGYLWKGLVLRPAQVVLTESNAK